MYDDEKKPSVISRLFKACAICIMLAMLSVLMVRFFVSCDSEIVDDILKTPEIEAAYSASPDTFEVQEHEIRFWYVSKNPADNEDSDMGGKILSLSDMYYIPATKNLQISVKFNCEILPDRTTQYSAELLPFELYLTDEDGNVYSDISMAIYDERYSYGYMRVNFEGIELLKNDGSVDQDGDPARKSYNLHLKRRNADGVYEDYEKFIIYEGKKYYSQVTYK